MTKHTPTPLYIKQYVDCKTPYVSICRENPAYAFGVSKGEEIICNVEYAELAAFIVKAVNCHDELVDALKTCIDSIAGYEIEQGSTAEQILERYPIKKAKSILTKAKGEV